MNEQQLNYLNIWRHDTKQDHHFTIIQCRHVECHFAECRGADYVVSLSTHVVVKKFIVKVFQLGLFLKCYKTF